MAWRRRSGETGLVVSTILVALAATSGASASSAPSSIGPGCDLSQAAVAHRGGGAVIVPQPPGAPVACHVSTGFAAAESHLVVTNSGAIVFTPAVLPSGAAGTGEGPSVAGTTDANAVPAAMLISRDQGGHWSVIKPFGVTWNPTDHADYVDPATGRLFYEDYGPIPLAPALGSGQDGPAHVMWSEDEGATWHHTVIPSLLLTENPRFTSAPAPAGQPPPVGYPDITYFCANTNVGFTSPLIAGRVCFKSLDGGTTWAQTTILFNGTLPRHPECGTSGEIYSAVDGYYPAPTSDGALYLLVACGGHTYLARSTDEASSFPIVRAASGQPVSLALPIDSITTAIGSGPQLRIDPAGNFYLLYPEVNGSTLTKLWLRVSRDRGQTWGSPVDITAPGVTAILRWAVAEQGQGNLGVAYLGQRRGQTTFDGYLTQTRDALSPAGPLLWSAVVSDPAQPLMYGRMIEGAGFITGPDGVEVPVPFPLGVQPVGGQVSAGFDFIGAAIAPDGTAWASFAQDCGPTPNAPKCEAQNDQTRGLAARLVLASATPATPAPPGGPLAPGGPPSRPPSALPATGATSGARLWEVTAALALAVLTLRLRRRHP